MTKKNLLLGILLLFISGANAKSKLYFDILKANDLCIDYSKDLSDKLAADHDFRLFYVSNVEFANKVLESGSGRLFQKYLTKTITPEELTQLLKNLTLAERSELENIGLKLKNAALLFIAKFPVLRQMPEEQRKTTLINAFKILNNEKIISLKSQKIRNVTPEECFWWWMACNTACFISCSAVEGNTCYWECGALCAGMFGLCWLWSE